MANSSDIDINEVITNLKATITSNKGGVSIKNLEYDYFNIIGETLPYRKLGYNSLTEFIQCFNVFKIEKENNDTIVNVLSDVKTKHLAEMIKKQKTSKKKTRSKKNISTNSKRIVSLSSTNTVYSKKPQIINSRKNCTFKSEKVSKLVQENFTNNNLNQNVNTQISANDPQLFNMKIMQLKIEGMCKKIVNVSAIYNPSSIWVVSVNDENSKQFSKMQIELNTRITNDQHLIKNDIVIGQFYALYHQQIWQRIIVESIDFNDLVLCFCIDTGKIMCANIKQIYRLESKFFDVYGQAIRVILDTFELIDNFPFINDILVEILLNKQFVLKTNSVITSPPNVTLYDIETKMNINDVVKEAFYNKVTPTFYSTGDSISTKVEVLSVVNGYCYLLKNKDLMEALENLLLSNNFFGPYLNHVRDINMENIYLATYKPNIKGRIKVMSFIDEFQVEIYFIDYGLYSVIGVKNLINLQTNNQFISKIPYQAVKVILDMFPPHRIRSEMVDMFYNILKDSTEVNVIQLKDFQGGIPCVQLFTDAYPNIHISIILYTRLEYLKRDFKTIKL